MRIQYKNRGLGLCSLLIALTASCADAQLASRPANEWVTTLDGPQRIETLKIDDVMARLRLKPGMVVADIGAGTGLFTRPIAKVIAPGKIYAVDIDKELLAMIDKRDKEENIRNVVTVLGEFDDPKLPVRDVDIALINDVLHHIKNRDLYLKALVKYLKPTGRVAIVEMDVHDPDTAHKGQPDLLVSREDMVKWMSDAGFRQVEDHTDLFPGKKVFLVFAKK